MTDLTDTPDLPNFWQYPLSKGDTLSSNEWVPMYLHRLLKSRFVTMCVFENRMEDLGRALLLWTESYIQDPAGTLPDDDIELAQLARVHSLEDWRAMRGRVMYGWVPCSVAGAPHAQRLGHPVIAEIAAQSFGRKAGKAAGRQAAALAVVRSRVKAKLVSMGRAKLAEMKPLVEAVAHHLHDNGLYVTDDNVAAALDLHAGLPRVVDGGFGARPR
jgi:hypothetical protein